MSDNYPMILTIAALVCLALTSIGYWILENRKIVTYRLVSLYPIDRKLSDGTVLCKRMEVEYWSKAVKAEHAVFYLVEGTEKWDIDWTFRWVDERGRMLRFDDITTLYKTHVDAERAHRRAFELDEIEFNEISSNPKNHHQEKLYVKQ